MFVVFTENVVGIYCSERVALAKANLCNGGVMYFDANDPKLMELTKELP